MKKIVSSLYICACARASLWHILNKRQRPCPLMGVGARSTLPGSVPMLTRPRHQSGQISRSPGEYKTILSCLPRECATNSSPFSLPPSPCAQFCLFAYIQPRRITPPTIMASVEKKELDSSSVEKGSGGKPLDFSSLHSGASPQAYPKADDELHFDERENDGVKRLLNQRHVQMFVYTRSLSSYVAYHHLAPTGSP